MWQTIVERWKSMTKEQKISLVILGVCGILAMGLSVYNISNTIRAPFLVNKSEIANSKKIIGETDDEKLAREKRTDTDGDGLSDWDESNIYHTNPNLRDSCGDGIPDNVRVLTGRNLGCLNAPNPGGNLDYSQVDSTSTDLFTNPQGLNLLNPTGGALGGASSTQDGASSTVVGGVDVNPEAAGMLPRDPVSIRQALTQSGKIDPAELSQMTDQQLLDIYDAAVQADTQSVNPGAADQNSAVQNPSPDNTGIAPSASTTPPIN